MPALEGYCMKLSAPIYQLKRQAKRLAKDESIALNQALDRLATAEGFASWSLLAQRAAEDSPAKTLFPQLLPGDLLLLGARPRQGKTMLALELIAKTLGSGNHAAFFTLDFTKPQLTQRLALVDESLVTPSDQLLLDVSDEICADYIVAQLQDVAPATLVVIDYLQALDRKRSNPDLSSQVKALRAFAKQRAITIVCIAQIRRSFDAIERPLPNSDDLHLPNPLDLGLFTKTCFLNDSSLRIDTPH